MRLIDADVLKCKVLEWMPSDPCGIEEKEFPFETDIVASLMMEIEEAPTVDAIPIGCLELEKRDCGFKDQCDMGSSYDRERERACKNIIDWWKTPSYQRCLEVAITRGFVDKEWSE